MWGTCILLLTVALNVAWCANISGGFAYPEENVADKGQQNVQGKKPVTGTCDENEYLYPGDQQEDWVCDCKPGHVYEPVKNKCYAAYLKGFCKNGEHLVLPQNEVIPRCARNPCNEGFVQYRGKCYRLNSAGPCEPVKLNPYIGVNEVTLEVECIHQGHLPTPPVPQADPNNPFPSRIDPDEAFKFPLKVCYIGGRRATKNECTAASAAE